MSPLNQTRQVGDDDFLFVGRGSQDQNTQMGVQRGKWIGRDAGMGAGDPGEEGGFSGIGKSEQSDASHHLEFETKLEGLGRPSGLRKIGRLPRRGGKMDIATSSASALRYKDTASGDGQIVEQDPVTFIEDLCPEGNLEHKGTTVGTMLFFAAPGFAGLRLEGGPVLEIKQGGFSWGSHKDDASAISAIPAIRTPSRNKFFPPEGNATVTPFSGFHKNPGFINKLGHGDPIRSRKKSVYWRRGHLTRNDMDLLAVTSPPGKMHNTRFLGEQGEVPSHSDVVSRIELRSPLSDQDVAGQDKLAVVPFHTQALRLAVSTIPG